MDKTSNQTMGKWKKWLILFNVTVSIFMATLDGSIVNIALPVISGELGVTISSIQWVVTSYLLAIAILLPIGGKLSDIYGKKKIFTLGFIMFTLGSTFCGLSNTLVMLVVSRVIQAVGASAMMALSQGIVTSIFPPGERGKALGITGAAVAVGSLVGPSLGGVLVHAAGWQSIFFINIPIGILGMILAIFIIPELHEAADKKTFDVRGAVVFSAAVLLLFVGLLLFQEQELAAEVLVPMLAVAAVLLGLFIVLEKRADNPLIDLKLFGIYEFSTGIASAFLSFVALNTTLLFMPFYMEYVLHLDTLSAGLLISAYPVATAVLAPVSGFLSDKISYKPLTVAGLVLNTLVLFLLSGLDAASSHVHIAVLMTLMGVGTALFQSPNNSSVMGSVPANRLGIAGGINALFRNLGMVSGTTFSVIIFTFTSKLNIGAMSGSLVPDAGLFLKGFRVVLLFASGVCLLGMLTSAVRVAGLRALGKVRNM